METALLYIEHNATDRDTGVHGLFGGEAWSRLCIWDPEGTLLIDVAPQGAMGALGLSDLFFESREPGNDERSVDDLLGAFPEGEYLIGAMGFDGVARVATARFTHAIAAMPVIVAPEVAEDEQDAGSVPLGAGSVQVSWEPVTETLEGEAVTIVSYEVIVTAVDYEDPDANSTPTYDVHMGPTATTLSVPSEFFEAGALYELEVIAIEESGNQTIGLGFFTTR
jgi:hypothetical protein